MSGQDRRWFHSEDVEDVDDLDDVPVEPLESELPTSQAPADTSLRA